MTPVPFDLPVRPGEAAEIANLIFDTAEGKPLTGELRNRLAARAVTTRLESMVPYFGSLERDPVHRSTYYLAIDGKEGAPLLLHITYSTAPSSGLYPKSFLVGRMRRTNGPEIVVNYVPFGPCDAENLNTFANRLDTAFLPHPQTVRPAIAVAARDQEAIVAAFQAYRTILKRTGLNLASLACPYHAGLWAAIRAGWRDGFTAEADLITVDDSEFPLEAAKEAIRQAAGFTKFVTSTSRLMPAPADARHPEAWSDAEVERRFESVFDAEERSWIVEEFARSFTVGEQAYEFSLPEAMRLAVKFGASLKANEELYEYIRATRSRLKAGRAFDFEPSLTEAPFLTTPGELIFYLHWLKSRGCAAQLVAPELGFEEGLPYAGETADLAARVKELAAVARHFQALLSVHSGGGKQAEVLEALGKATVGKLNYKAAGADAQQIDWLAENLIA